VDECSQAETDDPIDGPEHEDHTGPFRLRQQLAEAEDDPTFIFRQDLNRGDQIKDQKETQNQRGRDRHAESP
jgi:hypothetical protein